MDIYEVLLKNHHEDITIVQEEISVQFNNRQQTPLGFKWRGKRYEVFEPILKNKGAGGHYDFFVLTNEGVFGLTLIREEENADFCRSRWVLKCRVKEDALSDKEKNNACQNLWLIFQLVLMRKRIRKGGSAFGYNMKMMERKIEKIKLVILRVTDNCNLRCRYCYACGGDNREAMSWDIARKAIDYAAASGNPFKVQFTGGEPLLNLTLIREIVAYTRKKRITVRYQMQTNGTLITPQIAGVLKDMGIAPGISLDGMPEVNDRLRPFADGRGSTVATLQGLSNLGAAGVKVGLTAVLTAQSVTGLPRLVELAGYKGNVHGIALDLLRPLGRAGVNKILPPEPAIMEDSVRACLRRAEEIACLGGKPVRFREVERLKWQLSRRLTRQHYCYATTGQSFAVMPNGDVYPCSSLADLPDFYLGNISEQDFSLLSSLARLPFLRRKVSDLDGCRDCPDNWLCGGGCLARAYACNRRVDRPHPDDCRLKKVFLQYVREKLT